MEHITAWKAAIVSAIGAVSALFGWFGWLVIAYMATMLFDYITGTAAACVKGEWSSTTARNGCWHKVGSVIAIIAALLFDGIVGMVINHLPNIELPFTYSLLIAPVVIVWYIITELGSIVENAEKMGAKIPRFLARAIAALENTVEKAGDEIIPEKAE